MDVNVEISAAVTFKRELSEGRKSVVEGRINQEEGEGRFVRREKILTTMPEIRRGG